MNTLESCSALSPELTTDTCGKFIIEDSSVGYLLEDITTIAQEYTFAFWAKAEKESNIIVGGKQFDISTDWGKHVVTFIADSTDFLILFSDVGTYWMYHPKLEIGNIPTDWSKSPDDIEARMLDLELTSDRFSVELSRKVSQKEVDDSIDAIDEFHNTALDITADGVTMKTTGSIRAIVDDLERLSVDKDGVSAPLIVADDIVSPTIVRKQIGNVVAWKGGVQASINALPKYLTVDTTLTIPYGTYSENVKISGFVGAELIIELSQGVVINGTIEIANCQSVKICSETLGYGSVYPLVASDSVIMIFNSQSVKIQNIQISGYRNRTSASDGTKTLLYSANSNVKLYTCRLEYSTSTVAVFEGGTFDCVDCVGGVTGNDPTSNANLGYGIIACLGGHGILRGTYPISVNGSKGTTGTLLQQVVESTDDSGHFVTPDEITKSYVITKHCTYLFGMRRIREDQSTNISQGKYGSDDGSTSNWRIGTMWFGDAATELEGKTIIKAVLSMRRSSGGRSRAINVYLGSVSVVESEWEGTFRPEFVKANTFPIGSLLREEESLYDVTSLMPAVLSGMGIGVQEPVSDYFDIMSDNYATFYGKGSAYEPVLTVTYK